MAITITTLTTGTFQISAPGNAPVTYTITVAPAGPPPVSPDGTISHAPNGAALTAMEGVWSWGPAAQGRPGEYNVLLNSSHEGVGVLMQIANGGKLYVQAANGSWYLWHNGFSNSPGPAPPKPSSLVLVPAAVTLPDNSVSGAKVCSCTVTMSDGSVFSGTITVPAGGVVKVSGLDIVLARALTAADDGAHTYVITATQNNTSVTATLTLTIAKPAPATPVIAMNPANPVIPDTTPKGAVVTSYTVTMSDGSPFTGTVDFGPPNFDGGGVFSLAIRTLSTGNVIVNPDGPGVGPNDTTVTEHITLIATQ